jgi:hypothetical protein
MKEKKFLLKHFWYWLGGCFLFATPLWFLVAWGIDSFFPQPVADALYPIAMKVDRTIIALFFIIMHLFSYIMYFVFLANYYIFKIILRSCAV